ncbi:hypothetical protein BN2497_7651 [Janthinobacterium sp. CG23_2]|nr:hypothetical protein BN2497_7651 [Janthinobacterium sp. CG23_2]CUU30223.1 hypothetical protein BN3177_7651 [Janthinobacterium sp. CG23_2]
MRAIGYRHQRPLLFVRPPPASANAGVARFLCDDISSRWASRLSFG